MAEIWKNIPGFDGAYEVSNLGRVRSFLRRIAVNTFTIQRDKEPKILKPGLHTEGYMIVVLYHKGKNPKKFIHRLVLMAFQGHPAYRYQGSHLNGIRHDNRLENLKWCSPKENESHKIIHGTYFNRKNLTLKEKQVLLIRAAKKYPGYLSDLAKRFKVTKNTIVAIRARVTWKHIA